MHCKALLFLFFMNNSNHDECSRGGKDGMKEQDEIGYFADVNLLLSREFLPLPLSKHVISDTHAQGPVIILIVIVFHFTIHAWIG